MTSCKRETTLRFEWQRKEMSQEAPHPNISRSYSPAISIDDDNVASLVLEELKIPGRLTIYAYLKFESKTNLRCSTWGLVVNGNNIVCPFDSEDSDRVRLSPNYVELVKDVQSKFSLFISLFKSRDKSVDYGIEHTDNLSQVMAVLFKSEDFSDVSLVCQGKKFNCHKNVLSTRSPVFRAMLNNSNNVEVSSGMINITDMKEDELEVFLEYLYTGKVTCTALEIHAMSLFVTADKYDVQELKSAAESEIVRQITSDNVLQILNCGLLHESKKLETNALDFMTKRENLTAWQSDVKWQDMLKDAPLVKTVFEALANKLIMISEQK